MENKNKESFVSKFPVLGKSRLNLSSETQIKLLLGNIFRKKIIIPTYIFKSSHSDPKVLYKPLLNVNSKSNKRLFIKKTIFEDKTLKSQLLPQIKNSLLICKSMGINNRKINTVRKCKSYIFYSPRKEHSNILTHKRINVRIPKVSYTSLIKNP